MLSKQKKSHTRQVILVMGIRPDCALSTFTFREKGLERSPFTCGSLRIQIFTGSQQQQLAQAPLGTHGESCVLPGTWVILHSPAAMCTSSWAQWGEGGGEGGIGLEDASAGCSPVVTVHMVVCICKCMCMCVLAGGPVRQRDWTERTTEAERCRQEVDDAPAGKTCLLSWGPNVGSSGSRGNQESLPVTQYSNYSPWRCLRIKQLWVGEECRVWTQGVGSNCWVPSPDVHGQGWTAWPVSQAPVLPIWWGTAAPGRSLPLSEVLLGSLSVRRGW